MKCPRCRAEMKRKKLKEQTFIYQCPKCGLKIGNAETVRTEEDNEREVSNR